MRLITDEDLLSIYQQVIRIGLRYCNEAGSGKLQAYYEYLPPNEGEAERRLTAIKRQISTMISIGERELRPYFAKHFPDTALFFAHERAPGEHDDAVIITPETLLIQLANGADRMIAGQNYGISIHVALIRDGKPAHGICHYPFHDTTFLTWDDEAFIFHNKSKITVKGDYQPVAAKARGFYKKHGFPPELKDFRPADFSVQSIRFRSASQAESIAEQILAVGMGYADFTHNFTAQKIDIAAADAFVRKTGGSVGNEEDEELTYKHPLRVVTVSAVDMYSDLSQCTPPENTEASKNSVPEPTV